MSAVVWDEIVAYSPWLVGFLLLLGFVIGFTLFTLRADTTPEQRARWRREDEQRRATRTRHPAGRRRSSVRRPPHPSRFAAPVIDSGSASSGSCDAGGGSAGSDGGGCS